MEKEVINLKEDKKRTEGVAGREGTRNDAIIS